MNERFNLVDVCLLRKYVQCLTLNALPFRFQTVARKLNIASVPATETLEFILSLDRPNRL